MQSHQFEIKSRIQFSENSEFSITSQLSTKSEALSLKGKTLFRPARQLYQSGNQTCHMQAK